MCGTSPTAEGFLCVPYTLADAGQACDPEAEPPILCNNGFCTASGCVETVAPGEACTPDDDCGFNASCVNGTCQLASVTANIDRCYPDE